MDTRKLADVRPIQADARRRPRKNRTALFTALTLGAGAFCGVAAVLGVGPFSALHASAHSPATKHAPVVPINMQALFPVPSPVTKTVDVYDPPQAPRQSEASTEPPEHESEAQPTASPHETEPKPSPRPVPSPSPSPSPADE